MRRTTMDFEKCVMPVGRPPLRPFQPATDTIHMQQMEVDYYMAWPLYGMPHSQECRERSINSVPVIRFYGVTMEENSVLCHVHGFLPYFYVPAPVEFQERQCKEFQKALNAKIQNSVFSVELQLKQSIYGFFGNQKTPFLKITLLNPKVLPAVKRLLENEFAFDDGPARSYVAFESNLEFILRLMIDLKVSQRFENGYSWSFLACIFSNYNLDDIFFPFLFLLDSRS